MSEGVDYVLNQLEPDIMGSAYQPKRKKAVSGIDYILEQVTPDIMGVPVYSAMKTGNDLGKYLYNNAEKLADSALGAVTQADKGGSFGFGRKVGGVINAIGAAPMDALLTDKPFLQAFSDRYNEINDTALNSASRFENKHPVGAAVFQIGGGLVNPLNKIGAGYIAKGNGFANTLARSSLVGGETGVLAGLGRSETKDDIIRNIRDDALDGAAFGAAFPLAVKSAQMFGRQVFPLAKNKVQNIWNQNAGRQLDIKQAIANQENRYNNFLTENAEKEVFDAAPREFFNNLVPQSSFTPNVGIKEAEARNLIRNLADRIGLDIFGDIDHFTGSGRRPYMETLKDTINVPDVVYTQVNERGNIRNYLVKKYLNQKTKQPFYDFVIKNDKGQLFNKYNTNQQHIVNQFKRPTENLSFSRQNLGNSEPTSGLPKAEISFPMIYRNGAIVNPSLPNISTIERGLTDFQKKAFYEAMAQAVESSSGKVGSLGTTHIMQDTLGDMLKKSYKVSETGKKLPTAESLQLYELKTKLNELMKPTGIDKYEAGLAKADALRSAYRQGYGFVSPSSTAGGLSFNSLRERQAFLQGRLANHLRKAKDGHDLAAKIAADKETFRSLMPQRNYDNLMREIAKINAEGGDNLYTLVPYLVQILGETGTADN